MDESVNRPHLESVASIAAWVLVVISIVALTGCALNLPPLESFVPQSVGMKANSAACLLLAATSLLRRRHRDMPVYALCAALLGALTLAEYGWNLSLGIDELLLRDPSYFQFPGRMSQYTSFGYVLLGLAASSLRSRLWMVRELSRAFALCTGMLGAIALIAHLYDTHLPNTISPQANMSVPTALGFVIACIGVQYAHPREGLVRLLHAGNEGGAALRRLVPAGLVGSVLVGLAVRNAQQQLRWESGFSLALVAAGVTLCLMVVIVVTAAGLEREELGRRESELRFRLAANNAPVKIWMSGTDMLCTYFNDTWLQFTGRTMEQEAGDGWAEGVHPEDLERCMSTYAGAFERRENFQMEYRMRRHDGAYRWLLDTGVPRFSEGVFAGYIGSCVDITDRKDSEESLADLERKLLQAQEEERSRIARELHDDIVQRIAMLTYQVRSLTPRIAPDAKTRTAFEAIADHLRQLGTDIQSISHRLHSSHLEFLGLTAAAAVLCKEICAQKQVEINLSCDGIPSDLPKPVALSLYRVLQEALQNAIKYSGTKRFQVKLERSGDEVRLTVSDHGVGFEAHRADKQQGLGLISMRERMRMVGGRFSLESAPGKGTVIRCVAPIKPVTARSMAPDGVHMVPTGPNTETSAGAHQP
ncbi:MAG TPA: PAS domain S-box protein [Terracidiphilus sp.]